MHVRFWGVRGSVPWATSESIGHGCNTPCVEVRDGRSDALLILDGGSGLVGLGEALGQAPGPVPILLSHYHWDHLHGLPCFAPFYQRGWAPTIWAPAVRDVDVAWVETIFQSPFFPVPFEHLPSRPAVTLVQPREFELGSFQIRVQPLTHPGGAFAYRIVGPAGDLVYATDHEFGNLAVDDALAAFSQNAASVILDAHFTPEELTSHRGWGHGSWKQCAEFAAATGAGQLWLFHHKPGRKDAEMAAIEARARQVFPATKAASEGHSFEI